MPAVIEPFLSADLVHCRPAVATRNALFELLAATAVRHLESVEPAELLRLLLAREEQCPTVTPEGVAFPHALGPGISRTLVTVTTLDPAVPFDPSLPPASIVFGLFGSSSTPWEHVRLLARLARIAASPATRRRLREAADEAVMLEIMREEDRLHG